MHRLQPAARIISILGLRSRGDEKHVIDLDLR